MPTVDASILLQRVFRCGTDKNMLHAAKPDENDEMKMKTEYLRISIALLSQYYRRRWGEERKEVHAGERETQIEKLRLLNRKMRNAIKARAMDLHRFPEKEWQKKKKCIEQLRARWRSNGGCVSGDGTTIAMTVISCRVSCVCFFVCWAGNSTRLSTVCVLLCRSLHE